MEQQVRLQDTLKSQDTEEWIDLVLYRPLGYRCALFFKKINVTPNTVTVFSILLGLAAGVFFYFSNIWLNVAGMFLLIWANLFDSADGQLARMTGQFSRLGRMLDGAAGIFWFISIYAAICLRLTPEWGIYIWLFAAITSYFHSKQAAIADYLRNFHILFVKDKKINEFDDSVKIREQLKSLSWINNFVEKLFVTNYQSYTKGQEQWTPQLQIFRKALAERFGVSMFGKDGAADMPSRQEQEVGINGGLGKNVSADMPSIQEQEVGINSGLGKNVSADMPSRQEPEVGINGGLGKNVSADMPPRQEQEAGIDGGFSKKAFREASKPWMMYTNILTFNTRTAVLFICIFIGLPWVYFLFELTVMNILLFYLLYKYEAICKEFTVRLRRND